MTKHLTLLEKVALLSGATVWNTRDYSHADIRALWLSDGPHGIRKQTGSADHLGQGASQPATCFPTAATVANTWDLALAESLGRALGAEAAAQGVDVLLGPGLNVKRSPLCGRNFEYFSEDPYLSGMVAAGYVRGIQFEGVAACPKHFAANSQELRRMASDSIVDDRTLREIYLTGFEIAVRSGQPYSIMSSYNKLNGTYAHENHFLLQQVLRQEWGFDGAVISDWGGGNDPVTAVRAGGTLEMPSSGFDSAARIMQAIETGELSESELDVQVNQLIQLVSRVDGRSANVNVDQDAHHALARTIAADGSVLLKNDDGLLPLAPGTKVAVIGDFANVPRYQGAGSSLVNPTRLVTAVEAFRACELDMVGFAPGFTRGGQADPTLVAEAIEVARRAEVVVVYLGLDEVAEIEGRDRSHLMLPPAQVELLDALAGVSDSIVVVLSAGGVVEMPWLDRCTALVHGYLGGQAGAEAMIDVLTGAVNPSGKLAETYPVRLEDTPAFRYYPSDGPTAEYREGPYVGYRYYTTADVPVTFPFGFGLSYTTFAYGELEVNAAGVTFTVTNTGTVAGAEVTQLYISPDLADGTGVSRPVRELKGFAKTHLAPGESRRVQIPFDEYTFRHFSTTTNKWETETGTYQIQIGASVADIRLMAAFDVAGSISALAQDPAPHRYHLADVADIPDEEFAALLGRVIPPSVRVAGPLGLEDPVAAMADARSPLARGIYRILRRLISRADARGKPDLNLLFIYWEPFRVIAKMTGGMVSTPMVEAILLIVNGHFFRGIGALVRAAVSNRRRSRRLSRELDAARNPSV